jgi:uncharacterized protein YkwD
MKIRTISAISFATVLAGCGGGGGGSTSTPVPPTTPTTPTTPTIDPNALQLTVPNPTYTGSALSAYNTLAAARAAYGVGQYAQNAKLDTAAKNHALYITTRWGAKDFATVEHVEDPSKSGFTGINPSDRIAFAGYAAAANSEALTTFISVDGVTSDAGVVATNNLLSAPYHRFALLDSYRDVGVYDSPAVFAGEGGTNHTFVFNMAIAQADKQQLPAQSWVGTWPVDAATGVMYSFAGESPNPIPANNGACAGYPISVAVRPDMTLNTTTFTLAEAAGGQAISVQLSTAATDVNPTLARASAAYIIPFKPLKLNTKYTAHFVGSVNGTAVDKTWSFTTTAQNQKLIYGCDPS